MPIPCRRVSCELALTAISSDVEVARSAHADEVASLRRELEAQKAENATMSGLVDSYVAEVETLRADLGTHVHALAKPFAPSSHSTQRIWCQ